MELLLDPGGTGDGAAARERLERSARAYVYIHAIESTLREFIARRLREASGGDPHWLITALGEVDPELAPLVAGRKAAAERKRGYLDLELSDPVSYLTVAELKNIVVAHWELFEPELQDRTQFSAVFDVIHVSRNAIAHNRGVGPGLVNQLRAQALNLMSRIDGAGTPGGEDELDPVEELFSGRYGDLLGVFPTRSAARDLTQRWLAGARRIQAMGIALSEISQMSPLNVMAARIEMGVAIGLILLDPDSEACAARARAERRSHEELAGLIRASLGNLQRLHGSLTPEGQGRFQVRLIDVTPTASLYLIDDARAIMQPYPFGARAVEAPVTVAQARGDQGLVPHARHQFATAWAAARPVT